MKKSIAIICMTLLSQALPAKAEVPPYYLTCKIEGKLIKMADETVPSKQNKDDSLLTAKLPMKKIESFYTTGADYFVKIHVQGKGFLIYLHSSGYEFPFKQDKAVSFGAIGAPAIDLFASYQTDEDYLIITGQLATLLGIQGIEPYEQAVRVTCGTTSA